MPSTKGPAMGLPKKVCSRKPETARAPPSRAAVSSLGRRMFQTMALLSPWRVNRIWKTCCRVIFELPMATFSTSSTSSSTPRMRKPAA